MQRSLKSLSALGLLAALIALVFLTVMYVYFDPIMLRVANMSKETFGGDASIVDMNLRNFRYALPLMIIVIFLYAFTQGRKVDYVETPQYYR